MNTSTILAGFALAAVVVLSACGSQSGDTAQVASLHSNAAAPPSPSTEDSGRPQLRLDSSTADVAAVWAVYNACLKDHGHVMLGPVSTHAGQQGKPGDPPGLDMNDNSPASVASEKACARKLPLQPPELSAKTNPRYNDDFVAQVKCMNAQGAKVHIEPDTSVETTGLTWRLDNDSSRGYDGDLDNLAKRCRLQAFSGK